MHWFDVDKKGLAKLLDRRGKGYVVLELLQNAWDEQATRVDVRLDKPPESRYAYLSVEDNHPSGFSNLTHMFTLFAESGKAHDPQKRGRFNLGEKLVLAVCDQAEIVSVLGGYRFDENGRHIVRRRRASGSHFSARIAMTRAEYAECVASVERVIPPPGVITTFNGTPLAMREPVASFEAALPTEIADSGGRLRRAIRATTVRVYECRVGETAMLYEMGIPVVETGDRWHVDVMQKVPLNFERDNTPPSYLRAVRVHVLNQLHDQLEPSDVTAGWVRESVGDPRISEAAVRSIARERFGHRAVAFDPSDPEANKIAVSQGYTVVHGGSLSGQEWDSARRAGVLRPAGQVTPSPKPYTPGGAPLRLIDRSAWDAGMVLVAEYAEFLARKILGVTLDVRIANDPQWPFLATYAPGHLVLNAGRLGVRWFDHGASFAVNALLIHEFGHHYAQDHLSSDYHEALCRIGSQLAALALDEPLSFARFAPPRSKRVAG